MHRCRPSGCLLHLLAASNKSQRLITFWLKYYTVGATSARKHGHRCDYNEFSLLSTSASSLCFFDWSLICLSATSRSSNCRQRSFGYVQCIPRYTLKQIPHAILQTINIPKPNFLASEGAHPFS